MERIYQSLVDSGFCIKPAYVHRQNPESFSDVIDRADSAVCHPDVYRFAAFLAGRFGCDSLIDLGCRFRGVLTDIGLGLRLVRVDWPDNMRRFGEEHPGSICIKHGFGEQFLHIDDRELVARSVVVCANVFEHLINPIPLLASLRDLLEDAPIAIVTTPERDRVGGTSHMGPPDDRRRVREWSLLEFAALLRAAGLNIEFAGLTADSDREPAKGTILMVLRQQGTESRLSAPPGFRVVAFMCTYNEEDIIEATLHHAVSQGVEVHLVDNWSTDRTVERAEAFLGRGLRKITKFPVEGPSPSFDLHTLLRHVEGLSYSCDADWCIHYDADEIRESPWSHIQLRDALFRVEREGFNAIDHTCLVFHPTIGGIEDPARIASFDRCEFGKRGGHFHQIKAWRHQNAPIRLADSGGHSAEFPDRKVYPFKFLLRHYPVRSQEHGMRKIFADRRPRWNADEREGRGWHIQYDDVASGHNFLRAPSELLQFDDDTFYSEYLVERLSGIGVERS